MELSGEEMKKLELSEGSKELQCVGRLEIVSPKPVGFLCGKIPVPTDTAFNVFNSAIVYPNQEVSAPRYRMLPMETDLNRPPVVPNFPEKALPSVFKHSRIAGDVHGEGEYLSPSLTRKGEALAVYGVVEYGDEIDVIAPADILKQIFKMPYSKGRLSIAVHRIGQTLVMNTGPDNEEGETLLRRHGHRAKCADQSLFLNFAMHSVRVEACDCPPDHRSTSRKQSASSVLSRVSDGQDNEDGLQVCEKNAARENSFMDCDDYENVKRNSSIWRSKKGKSTCCHSTVKRNASTSGRIRSSIRESEYKRGGGDGFLRVLFWQFHNFRMLLGSDLLLFSNEKYAAVSLHLWDVARQVTPLTWLEAWLDNVLASVPELAICYHDNGVVQGYELLKTDDIFLLKGISDDGAPAFHPHVIQQNGLSVLRFLQQNCKEDPGAYWLYKSSGDDAIQLFDLSIISQTCDPIDRSRNSGNLTATMQSLKSDSLLSLGTLLYRIAHRLSQSMSSNSMVKCALFFKKCLALLDKNNHLVVRALAHEQFARLILNCDELNVGDPLLLEATTVINAEEDSLNLSTHVPEATTHGDIMSLLSLEGMEQSHIRDSEPQVLEASPRNTLEMAMSDMKSAASEFADQGSHKILQTSDQVHGTVSDPISSKLAAVHHVSQAIKSLRWKREQQQTYPEDGEDSSTQTEALPLSTSVCTCGDTECIEVCDIREWLPTSKLDYRLWNLVLLLGESYLALGEAYKETGQLHRTLKIVDLACSVYGSMPQYLEDKTFISSIGRAAGDRSGKTMSFYLFWARAWTLVGDVYVEFHMVNGKDIVLRAENNFSGRELRMSVEVMKEVQRLKSKLGRYNCSSCSLVNCSCQNDRASSGSSASSTSENKNIVGSGRKQNKRYHSSHPGSPEKVSVYPVQVSIQRSGESPNLKSGGIFKYLSGPVIGYPDHNLSLALCCYREARKALGRHSHDSEDLHSVVKKMGWVCNELGRLRLNCKELDKAELAFMDAISAFKEVSDRINIILIYCNLGHGRRALAEEMVLKIGSIKNPSLFRGAVNTAKLEYCESLKYYAAAKSEVDGNEDKSGLDLKNEVYTQFAHTYLRFGMLLAREDTTCRTVRKDQKGNEISANVALREALNLYETLGSLRNQEAAYAYFQLACFQRDCCLRLLEADRADGGLQQRAKQYASLAERSWQKSTDFYGPQTHPAMYLTILMERASLLTSLSSYFPASQMLESALSHLLEARLVYGGSISAGSVGDEDATIHPKFWSQLQALLKKMLAVMRSTSSSRSSIFPDSYTASNRLSDAPKLRELYKISLKSTMWDGLHTMHTIWQSH